MIEETKAFISKVVAEHDAPAIMSSFGKDAMVMLHMLREMDLELPVIFHRDPWSPKKNKFADMIIAAWDLVVYDWNPSACGIKVNGTLETVARYQVGPNTYFDIPKNIMEPRARESFACGLIDVIGRPKGSFLHPWDLYLIGHKSSDVDDFEGPMPLKSDYVKRRNAPALAFPLKDWTDADVWHYLNTRRVPVQETRYNRGNGTLTEDHQIWSNDYVTACTRCIDPRSPAEVECPKFNRKVPNVSETMLRFPAQMDYVKKG